MTTKEIITGLINEANALDPPLDVSDVMFGVPVQDINATHNTRLSVSAVPSSGYTGNVDVFYDRIALANTAPPSGFMSETPFTSQFIISQLNRHPEVPLEASDLSDVVVPELQVGDTVTLQVQAKDESLGWVGNVEVALLFGLPPNSDELYDLMNHQLPAK